MSFLCLPPTAGDGRGPEARDAQWDVVTRHALAPDVLQSVLGVSGGKEMISEGSA